MLKLDEKKFSFWLQHPPHGQRPKAPRTVDAYCESARYFVRYVVAHSAEKPAGDSAENAEGAEAGNAGGLDQETVEGFVRYLEEERKVSGATVARHLDGLRAYFAWKHKTFDMANPQVHHKLPRFLTDAEWAKLLKAATAGLTRPGAPAQERHKALFLRAALMVYAGAGLRRSEGVALRVEDLGEVGEGYLKVAHGKGDKPRMVAVEDQVLTAVREWVAETGSRAWVFPGQRAGEHLSPDSMYNMLKELYRRAGIKGAGVHTLRHTAGTAWVERGVDLLSIQQQLGHSKLETTTLYTHLADATRHRAIVKANRFGDQVGNGQ